MTTPPAERDQPLNILMIDSESTWRGGEGQAMLLMSGLLDRGFSVSLAAPPRAAITESARALGVDCLALPISGGMDLAAVWRLTGMLRERRFDVVHCHSSHAHSVAFMAFRVAGPGRPGHRPLLVISRRVDFPVARSRLSALKYRYGADVYLAISRGVRDVLIDSGVNEDRIRLVPSGISLEKFRHVKDFEIRFT